MEQKEADEVPDGLVEEGGVPIPRDAGSGLEAHAQEEAVKDLRAICFPVEEVAPAADALADEQTQGHEVQVGGQLLLLYLGKEEQTQDRADDAAVDGDAALPDVEGGDGIVLVVLPLEGYIVDPGADDGQGHGEEQGVGDQVEVRTEVLGPLPQIEDAQQEAEGDDNAVEIDLPAKDGKGQGPGRVDPVDPQAGEGDRACVKIHKGPSLWEMHQISIYYNTSSRKKLSPFSAFCILHSAFCIPFPGLDRFS